MTIGQLVLRFSTMLPHNQSVKQYQTSHLNIQPKLKKKKKKKTNKNEQKKRRYQVRATTIPDSVRQMKANKKAGVVVERRKTEKDLEAENGGAGIYDCDLRKFFQYIFFVFFFCVVLVSSSLTRRSRFFS